MSIVKVENLTKVYGKGSAQVTALDNVSFEVPKGQFLAIVGPSGSGKSTLLHLLGGVDRPTSGRVLIDGEDIYALNESNAFPSAGHLLPTQPLCWQMSPPATWTAKIPRKSSTY